MTEQTFHRWPWLDAARGFAILMMIAFHFCFDLVYWQLADFQLLSDWRWVLTANRWNGGARTVPLTLSAIRSTFAEDATTPSTM